MIYRSSQKTPKSVLAFAAAVLSLRDTSACPISDAPFISSIVRAAASAVVAAPGAGASVAFLLRRLLEDREEEDEMEEEGGEGGEERRRGHMTRLAQIAEILEKEDLRMGGPMGLLSLSSSSSSASSTPYPSGTPSIPPSPLQIGNIDKKEGGVATGKTGKKVEEDAHETAVLRAAARDQVEKTWFGTAIIGIWRSLFTLLLPYLNSVASSGSSSNSRSSIHNALIVTQEPEDEIVASTLIFALGMLQAEGVVSSQDMR